MVHQAHRGFRAALRAGSTQPVWPADAWLCTLGGVALTAASPARRRARLGRPDEATDPPAPRCGPAAQDRRLACRAVPLAPRCRPPGHSQSPAAPEPAGVDRQAAPPTRRPARPSRAPSRPNDSDWPAEVLPLATWQARRTIGHATRPDGAGQASAHARCGPHRRAARRERGTPARALAPAPEHRPVPAAPAVKSAPSIQPVQRLQTCFTAFTICAALISAAFSRLAA